MKKLVAIITVFAFTMLLAGAVLAQVDTRSPNEKINSARAYLKALDTKIVKYRKLGNNKMVAQLQADKKTTLARMQAWKAESEAAAAPPPAPRVAPLPPPPPPPVVARPRVVAQPKSAGLFGWGLNTSYSAGYLMGNSVVVGRGDMVLADPMGLGSMVGLSNDSVSWKIGLGGAMGKDINDVEKKAIPLFVDGIINIPADVMGGVKSYVGGGVNYVLYGSESKTGSYGGQVYYGIKGDVGLGGDSFVELSYSIIRSGTGLATPYSMKGIGINFGTELVL